MVGLDKLESAVTAASVLIQIAVCWKMWRDEKAHRFFIFIAYCWFILLREAVFLVLQSVLHVNRATYSQVYWFMRLFLEMPLMGAILGELCGWRWLFGAVALASGFLVRFTHPFPILWLQIFSGVATAGFVIAIFLWKPTSARARSIATGMVLILLFRTLIEYRSLYQVGHFHELFKLVPAVSLLAAQLIWLWGFYRADAVDARVNITERFMDSVRRTKLLFESALRKILVANA